MAENNLCNVSVVLVVSACSKCLSVFCLHDCVIDTRRLSMCYSYLLFCNYLRLVLKVYKVLRPVASDLH